MSAFIGEIRAFASELPDGWIPCEGQVLPINGNVPLYSAIGAQFGGDGETTFAVPDLRGRATAGVDPRREQSIGDTSGLAGQPLTLFPFATVRWAIAEFGKFPTRD